MQLKTRIILGVLAAGAVLLYVLWPTDPDLKKIRAARNQSVKPVSVDEKVVQSIRYEDLPEGGRKFAQELTAEQMVALLRRKYGGTIRNGYSQVRLIEELMRHYKEKFPDSWAVELYGLVKAAFPDQADEIFSRLEGLHNYNKWLADNRDNLTAMTAEERRDALWQMRSAQFGETAAQEIWAAELRNQKIRDALAGLGSAPVGASFGDKVNTYKEAIADAWRDKAPNYLERRNNELINAFLNVPTVQADLRAMNAEERRDSLREMRRNMGMAPDAVERWSKLDEERDARWDAGDKYMRERRELAAKYSGAELETQLRPLRERIFGAGMAEIIRGEEEAGFFQFDRPRRFGRE